MNTSAVSPPQLLPQLNFSDCARALRARCPGCGTDPDAPTLQVLDSDVADLSDELLPLEPVLPAVSSHPNRAAGDPGRNPESPAAGSRRVRVQNH